MEALGVRSTPAWLETSYRSPRSILEFAHAVLGPQAPEEVPRGVRDGPPVVRTVAPTEGHAAAILCHALRRLRDRDPGASVAIIARDAQAAGVEVRSGTAYLGRTPEGVVTSRGTLSAGYVVNAAGLYADRIARDYGFSEDFRILPFRGLYLYADAGDGFLKRHVYPVPELRYPFLGVHFTVTAAGRVKIGPTALPALWREHYGGLDGFRWDEFLEVGRRVAGLFRADDFEFRKLARRELPKGWKGELVKLAGELVSVPIGRLGWRWGKPGIRAQLVNVRERRLEMDFRYEGDHRSFHVLNAVSPAFTCAFPFAAHVWDQIDTRLRGSVAAPADLALQTVAQP